MRLITIAAGKLVYYHAQMVWICTIGLNFPSPCFLSSPLPPEFSGMNTYTVSLCMGEITKGFGERKVLRKSCRRIKSHLFLVCAHVLNSPLAQSFQKKLRHIIYAIQNFLAFGIFLPGRGSRVLVVKGHIVTKCHNGNGGWSEIKFVTHIALIASTRLPRPGKKILRGKSSSITYITHLKFSWKPF